MAVDPGLASLVVVAARELPNNPALGLMLAGRREEARRAARDAVRLNPGHASALYALALIDVMAGNAAEARAAAREARSWDEHLGLAALVLTGLAQRNWHDAENHARELLALRPGSAVALNGLAIALAEQGRRAEAIAFLAEAARANPRDANARQNLWRTWHWYLAGGLGILAGILIHLALEAIHIREEGWVARIFAVALVLVVVFVLWMVRSRRRQWDRMDAFTRAIVREEQQRRGRRAYLELIPAVALITAIVVGLLFLQVTLAAESRPVMELEVGDCLNIPHEGVIPEVPQVPCDTPHGHEVFAIVVHPGLPGDPYPGDALMAQFANSECQRAFAGYVGRPYTGADPLFVAGLKPLEPYWNIGIRNVYCLLSDRGGRELVGSMRRSGL